MKQVFLLLVCLILGACSQRNNSKSVQQPTAPWTYPIIEYRVIRIQAERKGESRVTRLVGWDRGFYYFDWSHATQTINRGTGRVERDEFDEQNKGALSLEKWPLIMYEGQVRTLIEE